MVQIIIFGLHGRLACAGAEIATARDVWFLKTGGKWKRVKRDVKQRILLEDQETYVETTIIETGDQNLFK